MADPVEYYAGSVWRLASGLADRGIPLLEDRPIDGAPVDTALAELDRLRAALAGAEQATTDARRLLTALATAVGQYHDTETRSTERENELRRALGEAEYDAWEYLRPADPNVDPLPSRWSSTIRGGHRPEALAADVPAAALHEHPGGYLSTACLHGLCEPERGAAQRARGDLSAPHCKYCPAPCTHSCHTGGQVARAERVHADGCTLAADDPHHAGWCPLAVAEPCGSCNGDRWVDDQNWQPEDYERAQGRVIGSAAFPAGSAITAAGACPTAPLRQPSSRTTPPRRRPTARPRTRRCPVPDDETARPGDMGVVDAIDQWYGVTDAGRTLHVVIGPVTVGVLAVCGQRVVREASPLDSTRLCRRCVRLTDVPAAGEAGAAPC